MAWPRLFYVAAQLRSTRTRVRSLSVIEFPHSPDERVQIESVGRFYRLLTATLVELA